MAKRGLMEQDLSKLDVNVLHPLSPEVISRQATINIGELWPSRAACFVCHKGALACRVWPFSLSSREHTFPVVEVRRYSGAVVNHSRAPTPGRG